MATKAPIAAARFSLSIDGVQIASFSELQGITTKVGPTSKGRKLLAHELTHLVQQNAGKRNVNIRLAKPDSDWATLQKLRGSTRKQIKLTAYCKTGVPTFALKGKVVKVDTNVMQQEWTLTFESIQRLPA